MRNNGHAIKYCLLLKHDQVSLEGKEVAAMGEVEEGRSDFYQLAEQVVKKSDWPIFNTADKTLVQLSPGILFKGSHLFKCCQRAISPQWKCGIHHGHVKHSILDVRSVVNKQEVILESHYD